MASSSADLKGMKKALTDKKKGPDCYKIGMGRLIPEAWPTLEDFLFVYGLLLFANGFSK